MRLYVILVLCLVCLGCLNETATTGKQSHFERIPSEQSGLNFSNILDEVNLKNPFDYINAYIGGGVSIGDINNDGLQDVYLTANMTSSKSRTS